MYPLPSTNYAGRLLMTLAAIASIFFITSCGSGSGFTPPNQTGFSNSSLSGTYVFSSSGSDTGGLPISLAGALVANGSGSITGGTMDVIDLGEGVATGQTLSGSYRVTSDGRGTATLNTSVGSFALDFVLTSTSHGLVTQFDNIGGGSGTIDLQTPVTNLTQLAGPYAMSVAGSDSGGGPFASVGSFTLNSSGVITAGIADFNDAGSVLNNIPLAGTATLGSGTGPGTITFAATSQTYDFYPIDATHLKFIEVDDSQFLSGDVFSQTGASIATGPMVFTMSGGTSVPISNGGLMSFDGTTFTGSEDLNNNGTVVSQLAFTGTAGPVGSVGGRVVVSLSNFVPAIQWVVYPSSGGLLMLENDSQTVTIGGALAQTPGQTIGATQNYGFNLSAFNISGIFQENDIAQFLTTSTTFSGLVDINDNFGNGNQLFFGQALTGNYTLDSPATGRGEATTIAGGSGFVSFNFYIANSSNILLLETDNNQIGTGIFQIQTVPSGGVAMSRIPAVRTAFLSPAARSRVAQRQKQRR
jgi:hypothetical protein